MFYASGHELFTLVSTKETLPLMIIYSTSNQLKASTELQSGNLKTTNQARNLSVVMGSDLN